MRSCFNIFRSRFFPSLAIVVSEPIFYLANDSIFFPFLALPRNTHAQNMSKNWPENEYKNEGEYVEVKTENDIYQQKNAMIMHYLQKYYHIFRILFGSNPFKLGFHRTENEFELW